MQVALQVIDQQTATAATAAATAAVAARATAASEP